MIIVDHSIVYSGLEHKPVYAAATPSRSSIWAAAYGNKEHGAARFIDNINFPDRSTDSPHADFIMSACSGIHPELQRMGTVVSVAGAFLDNTSLHLFNIGNARALLFTDGYMSFHTADHSEAYENDPALVTANAAAYDSLRGLKGRLVLKRALGLNDNPMPQFYPPVPLTKNMALLICTERFWHYISVIEMELDYRKSAGPEEWLKIMTRRVLMKAGNELDHDNFAVIAAMMEE